MCSLFGMLTAREQSARRSLLSAPSSLAWQSRHCPHGWGLSFTVPTGHGRQIFFHDKWPERAADSPRFAELAVRKTHLLVGHVRKRTTGAIDQYHTQPFAQPGIALAHSGGLGREWHRVIVSEIAYYDAARDLPGNAIQPVRGRTSGERLAAWLALQLRLHPEREPDEVIAEPLRRLVQQPDGIISANFVLGYLAPDGPRLYAFRLTPNGKHQGLYCRTRGATLVTSRPTDRAGDWREIPNGALLIARLPGGGRPKVAVVSLAG